LSYVDDQKDISRFPSITNFLINFYNLLSIFLELMENYYFYSRKKLRKLR